MQANKERWTLNLPSASICFEYLQYKKKIRSIDGFNNLNVDGTDIANFFNTENTVIITEL